MATRHWLTIAVAVGASLAVTAAEAATKKRGGAAPLVARGCTHPLGTLCLGITTTRGQTFAVYNPNPWMPLRIGANVYGRMVGNGNCGPGIEVSSWKADKKITCSDRR